MTMATAKSATASAAASPELQYMMPKDGGIKLCQLEPRERVHTRNSTFLAQGLGVDPVEAGTGTCKDAAAVGQQRDQFVVPPAHLAARAPEGPEDGGELAPEPSRSAWAKAGRWRSAQLGRTTSNSSEKAAYVAGL